MILFAAVKDVSGKMSDTYPMEYYAISLYSACEDYELISLVVVLSNSGILSILSDAKQTIYLDFPNCNISTQ